MTIAMAVSIAIPISIGCGSRSGRNRCWCRQESGLAGHDTAQVLMRVSQDQFADLSPIGGGYTTRKD